MEELVGGRKAEPSPGLSMVHPSLRAGAVLFTHCVPETVNKMLLVTTVCRFLLT